MRHLLRTIGILGGFSLLVSCASDVPPTRIGDYVSSDRASGAESLLNVEPRPIQAGLVLVSDTSEAGAAPNLPDEALVRLGENLKQDIERALPVMIKEIVPADHIRPQPNGDWQQFTDLARQRRLEYLVVVVVSSTEQEYPVTVFLGWTTHAQPGYRRDNWSLLELALLDLKDNKTLLQAEGRGWATLDRPTAPDINQWYPVVYLRPQDPERRIWPPTYEGAPNTLRVVSFEQAEKRLASKLQHSWLSELEEATAAQRSRS
ncbi:conserved exported protein of unknown function [Nitrospira sp. KM1]|uniref:hypothetical protein n=1 Tax=Nitrospira sp. KM1 TaxID=1936990 RepID=UPI0013A77F9F|nr:hypothetical protein [Nitrospira sp. KM1]BCA54393.1 conserved exported protein of unknown function [Nitrospira sp. KM1]